MPPARLSQHWIHTCPEPLPDVLASSVQHCGRLPNMKQTMTTQLEKTSCKGAIRNGQISCTRYICPCRRFNPRPTQARTPSPYLILLYRFVLIRRKKPFPQLCSEGRAVLIGSAPWRRPCGGANPSYPHPFFRIVRGALCSCEMQRGISMQPQYPPEIGPVA